MSLSGKKQTILGLMGVVLIIGVSMIYMGFLTPKLEAGLDDYADLFVSGQGGYHTYRIPALISLPDGTVIAFCEGRVSSSDDYGDIDIIQRRYTRQSGWSEQTVVVNGDGSTAGNPCPVFDSETQTIFLLFCIDNDDVYVINSTDYGVSWGVSRNITASVKLQGWEWYATGPGHAIQLSSGRLLIPCDHGSKEDDGIHADYLCSHVIYSDDHGLSWELGHIFEHGDECTAVETADNSVYLNMRQPPQDRGFPLNQRLYAISTDGGDTFGAVNNDPTLIEPRCQASICRFSKADEAVNGWNRVLFVNPESTRRQKLTIKVSYDECQSWTASKLIFTGHSAYSDVQVGENKDIYILFERGAYDPYERITFVNTTIDWIEN